MSNERPRRLRGGAGIRALVAGTRLAPGDFVAPIFVRSGEKLQTPVPSMPGVVQFSVDSAVEELRRIQGLGVGGFILFGVTDAAKKDATGSWAMRGENEVCRTLKAARDAGITMVAMTDLCFCEYTAHGHCGILKKTTPGAAANVDNDETIRRLAEQAVLHAKAGADVVAPSAMMDNQVAAIRTALDSAGCDPTLILSYSVKYASAFYGPFRDAAQSPPQFGDRSGYQMDVRGGVAEALREAQLDVLQGADMVMVKPALPYLDVLRAVTDRVNVPTAAYHVSGEYAMLKAAAANGWIDEKRAVVETMLAIKRAGANFILTYYAAEAAQWV